MIEFTQGNLFDGEHQAIVNPVNCVGRSGKGLALLFKKRFPAMFLAYKKYCDEGKLRPGTLHTYKEGDLWIVNFPTKDHWRNNSEMEYITKGLKALVSFIKKEDIKDIGIPALGCGLGGLLWYQVRGEIKKALEQLDIKITVYEP